MGEPTSLGLSKAFVYQASLDGYGKALVPWGFPELFLSVVLFGKGGGPGHHLDAPGDEVGGYASVFDRPLPERVAFIGGHESLRQVAVAVSEELGDPLVDVVGLESFLEEAALDLSHDLAATGLVASENSAAMLDRHIEGHFSQRRW
ncbi:hypothetical protein PG994_005494 [Apiospora phragmitis]|uniref:Uncharacterized protein n=1 Tax=Apiospora phragmitis TaxID=2905665 RepID=A0ABR1VCE4_9PEZI